MTATIRTATTRQGGVSILRNTLVANAATLFSILTGFFLTPLLLHALGTDQFGLWSLLVSLVAQLAIVQCGLNSSVPRQVATYLAVGKRDELERLFSTSCIAYLTCGAIALIATGVLLTFPQKFAAIPAQHLTAARWTIAVLGINQAASFLVVLRDSLVFGSGRMFMTSSINVVVNTLLTLGFVIVAKMGYGTVGMAWVMLASTVINVVLYKKLLSDDFSSIKLRLDKFDLKMLRELGRVGRSPFVISLSGTLGSSSNAIIVGALLSPHQVAFYALSARLVVIINNLSTKFSSVSLPVYAQAHATGDVPQMRRIFTESVSVALGIVAPFLLVSLALGHRVLLAWVGPGNDEVAWLWTLGLTAFLCRVPGGVCITLLTGIARAERIIWPYLVAAALNAALSYFLTRQLGTPGVYWGTIIVCGFTDVFWLPLITCRESGFSLREFWAESLMPLMPALIVGSLVAGTIFLVPFPVGTLWTLVGMTLILVASWTTWFFVGLPQARRERFLRAFGGVWREALGKISRSK